MDARELLQVATAPSASTLRPTKIANASRARSVADVQHLQLAFIGGRVELESMAPHHTSACGTQQPAVAAAPRRPAVIAVASNE